jgi:hypothetical protein
MIYTPFVLKQKIQSTNILRKSAHLITIFLCIVTVTVVTYAYWAIGSFPYTHDGENHLARFANYKIALKEGQFPPRIGPNLHNRYGYPVFNFNYPLANILSVPFSVLKIPYEITFSIQVIIAVFAAWIGVWFTVKNALKKMHVLPATLASLYLTTPYLTTALFYRGNIGEIWAFALFPWLYLTCIWLYKYQYRKNDFTKLITTLAVLGVWIAFLLAHNLAVLISVPMVLAFAMICFQNSLATYARAIVLGLVAIASTLWFWLPALMEKQYTTLSDVSLSSHYNHHFLNLYDIFVQAHLFGFSLDGVINSGTPSLGVPFLVLLILFFGIFLHQITIYISHKRAQRVESTINKVQKTLHNTDVVIDVSTSLLLMGVALFSLLMSTTASSALWELNTQLSLIQFPWRWLLITPIVLVIGFVTSVSSYIKKNALAVVTVNRVLVIILLPLLVMQLISITRYSPADTFTKNNEDYEVFTMTTSTQNENMPRTFHYADIGDWQPTPTIISPTSEDSYYITVIAWNGSKRTYSIVNTEPVLVAEPTMYFPGWKTKITTGEESKFISLQESTQEYESELQGRIGFLLQPGNHTITTKFTQDTWPRTVGNTISALSFIMIFVYSGYTGFKLLKKT